MTSELDKIYTWKVDSIAIIVRYFLFVGFAYFIFYVWKVNQFKKNKIQPEIPSRQKIVTEIIYSISTLLIYCVASWMAFLFWNAGITKIYLDINKYGWPYFYISFILIVFIHDAYFYWTHRLLHWKFIYKWSHKVHHNSDNPTPWAAFSFHPVEAIITAGIIPIILFCVPAHPFIVFIFFTFMVFINVIGHLGYEIFPLNFRKSKFGRFHNTSTNHNLHHQNIRCNYGLYFTFWDKLMNTYKSKMSI